MKKTLVLTAALALLISGSLLADPTKPTRPEPALSPLAAYPGFGHNEKADDDAFEREEMAREHLVARCMENVGFLYRPTPSLALERFDSPSEAMDAMRPDLNGRYERKLPQDEQLRFRASLYGVEDPMSDDADLQPDPLAAEGGGCVGESRRALPGVFAAKAKLQQEFDALRTSVMQSQQVRAAEHRWAGCMKALGSARKDASPRALERRQDHELAGLIGLTKATLPSREALAELGVQHRAERQQAMKCALEVDLPGTVNQVRVDLEGQFVAEHLEVLERHLESLEEQGAVLREVEATY